MKREAGSIDKNTSRKIFEENTATCTCTYICTCTYTEKRIIKQGKPKCERVRICLVAIPAKKRRTYSTSYHCPATKLYWSRTSEPTVALYDCHDHGRRDTIRSSHCSLSFDLASSPTTIVTSQHVVQISTQCIG